jgi:adenylate cyclase
MFRLPTVRAKLTALVASSAVVTFTAMPVISWIMDRQLVDEVDDRVPESLRGFDVELADDLRDLSAIVEQLSSEADVAAALRARDGARLTELGNVLHGAYPEIDLLFFGPNDERVAGIEVDAPPESARAIPELANLAPAASFQGISEHGCEGGQAAPPGFVAAKRIASGGMVVGCLPLDADFVRRVQATLGGDLAFVAPGSGGIIGKTAGFPPEARERAGAETSLLASGGKDWAIERVAPPAMKSPRGTYEMIVALDVTDVRDIVRHNFLLAMGVLAAATMFSLVLGARLARIMSLALSKVVAALEKLRREEYVHVEDIDTGDELEDLAAGFNTMVDGLKERDKLRATLGKYMTETVVEHLMNGKVQLGGETLTVTILFSDIRSFTTMAERMHDAQALVGLLNEYFTEMVGIIMQEGGVVDKYIGDAIMAVFGAPVSKPDDAVRAVRAAVRMRKALAALNERLAARGIPPLRTGIGIHTGEVVAGNIGSEQRMEYTVIGDAVNLASRLETNTKELGVDVLISADTYALVKGTCVARPLREITVKGRSEPVMTYEVRGVLEETPAKVSGTLAVAPGE